MKDVFPTAGDGYENPDTGSEGIYTDVWGPSILPHATPTWSHEERDEFSKLAADREKIETLRADIEQLLAECELEDLEAAKAAIARQLELGGSEEGSKDG